MRKDLAKRVILVKKALTKVRVAHDEPEVDQKLGKAAELLSAVSTKIDTLKEKQSASEYGLAAKAADDLCADAAELGKLFEGIGSDFRKKESE